MDFTRIAECRACPLFEGCTSPVNVNHIALKNRVLVVAEKPVPEEDNLQMAWSDRHSRFVSSLIKEVFGAHVVNYTYAVKCCHDKASVKSIRTCVDKWLLREVVHLEPKVMIVMGKVPYKLLSKPFNYNPAAKPGTITVRDSNKFIGFWDSPFKLFNGPKQKINSFKTFLISLRNLFEGTYNA